MDLAAVETLDHQCAAFPKPALPLHPCLALPHLTGYHGKGGSAFFSVMPKDGSLAGGGKLPFQHSGQHQGSQEEDGP